MTGVQTCALPICIDIIPWTHDPARFACAALAPAEVSRVYIDDEDQAMEIIVPDDQLSLAIGKKGQNVRLAAKLIGWKIDIKSESRAQEEDQDEEPVSSERQAAEDLFARSNKDKSDAASDVDEAVKVEEELPAADSDTDEV